MRFETPLQEARLLRRYQRFLADMQFPDGHRDTVHCPNTGAMLGCDQAGSQVWVSRVNKPSRKYPWTWELVRPENGPLVGIHTGRSNRLVQEAILTGVLEELQGYARLQAEVPAAPGYRADFWLSGHVSKPDCFLEVKNVTAAVDQGVAIFPDAVSARASRHLHELLEKVRNGNRAVLCYCVQRDDVREVRAADAIDPEYGKMLRAALHQGVEVCAYAANVTTEELLLYRRVAVNIE
ncbi:MAG: DNA/RNA nuclease SfsA [Gammaproteobacteria bacterium]|nr:DNA/RNA nuclease SfsA [Gammaproteobacteria bacterium]MDE2345510.1 DNA/RNA nuclease SfsA [Gammaproteobacteria bacterium]